MPPIYIFRCDYCGFSFPPGWGGYMYVEDNEGKRIVCPHPIEFLKVREVLGKDADWELIKERTGFNSHCVCLDCLHRFDADLRDEKVNEWRFGYRFPTFDEAFRGDVKPKDKRECPKCKSKNVRTVYEMIGQKCPKCGEGKIRKIETGLIS